MGVCMGVRTVCTGARTHEAVNVEAEVQFLRYSLSKIDIKMDDYAQITIIKYCRNGEK